MRNDLFNEKEVAGARSYLYRKHHFERPEGRCDNGGRWYPKGRDEEVMGNVRAPSRSYPWSYYKAAFTVKHCAALHGVDDKRVRRLVRLVGEPPVMQGQAPLKDWIENSLDTYAEVSVMEARTAPAVGNGRQVGRL